MKPLTNYRHFLTQVTPIINSLVSTHSRNAHLKGQQFIHSPYRAIGPHKSQGRCGQSSHEGKCQINSIPLKPQWCKHLQGESTMDWQFLKFLRCGQFMNITAFTASYCTLAKSLPKAFFTYISLTNTSPYQYGCMLKWNKCILYLWWPCPVDTRVPHSLRLPSSHPSSLPFPSRLPKQGTRRYFKWLQFSSINRSQSSDTLSIEVSWAQQLHLQQLPRNACLYLEADSPPHIKGGNC